MHPIPEKGIADRATRREAQKDNFPKLKLMMATPYYMQTSFARNTDSMIEVARFLSVAGIQWQKHTILGDSYIDRAKNSIIADFLESDCTDLLMIDSDMSFGPAEVSRMLCHSQQVVGGFFPMKNNYGTFAGALKPGKNGEIFDAETAIELEDGSCLFESLLIPGGFLRLKRDVLERFADHYPENVYQDPFASQSKPDRVYTNFFECRVHNYLRYGEDAHFCHLMREMGETLWCDPNLSFGHTGMKTFMGNFHNSLLKPEEELAVIRAEREKLAESITAVRVDAEEVVQ